jgi:hypothetical protein
MTDVAVRVENLSKQYPFDNEPPVRAQDKPGHKEIGPNPANPYTLSKNCLGVNALFGSGSSGLGVVK